eukprot:TRINITY_DN1724_c0_g1_i1.p1 TRINITY_DN1724_c0_g1~~TRINITY_DN1724_c0_g1_i1.p1  ORF type:complete len:429 (+),score=82.82 TRINITY_DN1724_c0_g1_i1:163-1449(+)
MDYTGRESCRSSTSGGEAKLQRANFSLFEVESKDCGQRAQMGNDASRCPNSQNPPFQFWLGRDDDELDSMPADTDTSRVGTQEKPSSECVAEAAWERERRELEDSQVRFMRAVHDQKQLDESVEWLLKQLDTLPTKSLSISTADAQECSSDSEEDSNCEEVDVETDPGTNIRCHAHISLTSTEVGDTGFDLAGAQSQRQAALAQLSLAGVHVYPLVAEKPLPAQSTPLQCESHRLSGDKPIVEGTSLASAETSSNIAPGAAETAATWPGQAQENVCIMEARCEVSEKFQGFSSEPSDVVQSSCSSSTNRTRVSTANNASSGGQRAEECTSFSCMSSFVEQPKMVCQSFGNGCGEWLKDIHMTHAGSPPVLGSNNRCEELDFSQAISATQPANDATTLPPSLGGASSGWGSWQLHASPRGKICKSRCLK